MKVGRSRGKKAAACLQIRGGDARDEEVPSALISRVYHHEGSVSTCWIPSAIRLTSSRGCSTPPTRRAGEREGRRGGSRSALLRKRHISPDASADDVGLADDVLVARHDVGRLAVRVTPLTRSLLGHCRQVSSEGSHLGIVGSSIIACSRFASGSLLA